MLNVPLTVAPVVPDTSHVGCPVASDVMCTGCTSICCTRRLSFRCVGFACSAECSDVRCVGFENPKGEPNTRNNQINGNGESDTAYYKDL